jgi:hypothetical protein
MGGVPRVLSDVVAGIVDLGPFVLFNQRENLSPAATAVAAVGPSIITGIQVPAGEAWWVQAFTVYATLAAGQSIRIAPALTVNNANQMVGDYVGGVALEAIRAFMSAPPIILNPGDRAAVLCQSIVAGPVNVDANIAFVRFRI